MKRETKNKISINIGELNGKMCKKEITRKNEK